MKDIKITRTELLKQRHTDITYSLFFPCFFFFSFFLFLFFFSAANRHCIIPPKEGHIAGVWTTTGPSQQQTTKCQMSLDPSPERDGRSCSVQSRYRITQAISSLPLSDTQLCRLGSVVVAVRQRGVRTSRVSEITNGPVSYTHLTLPTMYCV